jgi:hypothetical protein
MLPEPDGGPFAECVPHQHVGAVWIVAHRGNVTASLDGPLAGIRPVPVLAERYD